MGQSEKPWTTAIREFLSDGLEHDTEEAINVGAAVVSDERAKQEMGSKQSNRSETDRIWSGKRNVAKQALTGMTRFGKAAWGDAGKKTIKWLSEDSTSIGEVSAKLSELSETVEQLLLKVEALESTVDYLEKKDTGEADGAGEQYLASVGVNSNSESSE